MHLSHLPLEVITRILEWVSPVDIVRVRMTCKFLESASYDRNLWKHIFLDACVGYGVVEGTYNIPGMSGKDLECATLQPFRFARRAFRSKTSIEPISTTILDLPVDLSSGLSDIVLMAGGRFLFTIEGGQAISLWDLNDLLAQKSPAASPTPLACLRNDETEELLDCTIDLLDVLPSSAGTVIRAMVWAYNQTRLDRRIYVYEIPFGDTPPTFHRFRESSTLFKRPCLEAFDGDRATLEMELSEGKVAVWDLETNATITWDSEKLGNLLVYDSDSGGNIPWTILSGNRFARFRSIKEIPVYEIPKEAFHTYGANDREDVAPARIATLNAPGTPAGDDLDSHVDYWVSQPTASTQSFRPTKILERTTNEKSDTHILRLFLLDPTGPLPALLEISSVALHNVRLYDPDHVYPRAYHIGDSFAILWIEMPPPEASSPGSLSFKFSITEPFYKETMNSGGLKENQLEIAQTAKEEWHGAPMRLQFCTLSGRLILKDELHRIVIKDYYEAQSC